jgi:hypothetical protein
MKTHKCFLSIRLYMNLKPDEVICAGMWKKIITIGRTYASL